MIEGGDIKHSGLHHYSYDESGNVGLNQTGFEIIDTVSTTPGADGIPANERRGFFCGFKLIGGADATPPAGTVTFETFHGDGSTGPLSAITITDISTGEMIHGPFKRLALASRTADNDVQLLCIKG